MALVFLKQIVPSPVIIQSKFFMSSLIDPQQQKLSVSTTAFFTPSFSSKEINFYYVPISLFNCLLNKLPFINLPDCHYPLIIMTSSDKRQKTPSPFYLLFTMSPSQYPFQYIMKPAQIMIELLFSMFVQDLSDDYWFIVITSFFLYQSVTSSILE